MKSAIPILIALVAFGLASCGNSSTHTSIVQLKAQTLTVACGMCIFQIPDSHGCYWAAEIDGVYYVVQGNTPKSHENHAPDGMCNMSRLAIIDGTLEGRQLFAKRFELLEPQNLPETPTYTPADLH
jgi:hypothetical protein